MPPDAREVFRLRVSPSGTVSFARELIPELIPPQMRGNQMCGQKLGAFGAPKIYTRLRKALRKAIETGRVTRVTFLSILTGKPRITVFLPLGDGGVMVRVFAENDEVTGLAVERRKMDGTNGE